VHPQTHFVLSWLTGFHLREWRDRTLVAWSGLMPDVDGLSAVAGLEAYGRWHHLVTHGLVAALCTASLAGALGRERAKVFLLSLLAFHIHLLCDLLGSGAAWGIAYFYPFSRNELFNPHGWPLASWQNIVVTGVALLACGCVAVRYRRSFLEACLPRKVDAGVVDALRRRFASADPEAAR
jgi:hypothetical protein